ncbi:PLP-dependent aminotransferase family protein [Paraburkholderia sp. GAS42]|jgi:GntR family transcriptional regulator/MocR family aminotransferase|uniref:MocR-like pyridoxine biosynthesis transcription factor PdxR n=1 Tax=Paraburkholderia sp. GAS42 TaxID=3035135 RepID=UPI003D1E3EE2
MDLGLLLSAYARQQNDRKLPRQRMLYEALRSAILDGTIAQGTRLVATRVLAEELGIARNSVLYAYERLAAEGFLEADRHGSVVAHLGLQQQSSMCAAAPLPATLSKRVAGLSNDRDALKELVAFRPGLPALDEFPLAQWRAAMERAWRGIDASDLGYGGSHGHPWLRRAIADYLKVSRGVRCDLDQVFVTDGTQTSFDVAARVLADPGDIAWIENPGYNGARAALQAAGLRVVPIPVDAHGIAPTPAHWQQSPPKLIYITPSHQYPLGSVLSLERRVALIDAARAHGTWIIEDDYDSEFRHEGPPLSAVQGLAADTPVVYVGTFSKTLFPALRLGFMVVPAQLADAISLTMGEISRRGRVADQVALADFIDRGMYSRHLRRMRRLYSARREALLEAIECHLRGVVTVSGGAGGMHLTARLDVPLSDVEVGKVALVRRIVVPPVSGYCLPAPDAERYNGFVLGYAGVPADETDGLVAQVANVIETMLSARES